MKPSSYIHSLSRIADTDGADPMAPCPDEVEAVIAALENNAEFMRIVRENPAPVRGIGITKYLEYRLYVPDCFIPVHLLGIDALPPQRIFDIGTGFGYFPYICESYDHEVLCMDLDTVPLYNASVAALGLDRRTHRIERFQPLPDIGRFDLITAFSVCFNRHNYPDVWGRDEWWYFLRNLVNDHLTPHGRIFMRLNPEVSDGAYGVEGLKDFFLSLDARITGMNVDFPDLSRIREIIRQEKSIASPTA